MCAQFSASRGLLRMLVWLVVGSGNAMLVVSAADICTYSRTVVNVMLCWSAALLPTWGHWQHCQVIGVRLPPASHEELAPTMALVNAFDVFIGLAMSTMVPYAVLQTSRTHASHIRKRCTAFSNYSMMPVAHYGGLGAGPTEQLMPKACDHDSMTRRIS